MNINGQRMYYKVVRREYLEMHRQEDAVRLRYQRTSAVVRGAARVVYVPNRFVMAPKFLREDEYYLTVFEEYDQAHRFMYERMQSCAQTLELWGCVCGDDHEEYAPQFGNLGETRYKPSNLQTKWRWEQVKNDFWSNRRRFSWPEGTVMAWKVKLVYLYGVRNGEYPSDFPILTP